MKYTGVLILQGTNILINGVKKTIFSDYSIDLDKELLHEIMKYKKQVLYSLTDLYVSIDFGPKTKLTIKIENLLLEN